MRGVIVVLCCVSIATASQAASPRLPMRLSTLAHATLNKDFRIQWHLEKNAQICGGEGDAWIGQVEMNTYRRAIGGDRNPTVVNNWVKLEKYYSIFVRELSEPNPKLFDHDNCLE